MSQPRRSNWNHSHTSTRSEIPFTARLAASTSSLTGKFILELMAPLQNATLDLFGSTIEGIPRSSPSPSVGKENLVFGGNTPFSYDGSFRRMGLQLKKNVPGSWLYALDMSFYVDLTSMDPDEWYLISMVYSRQVFSSVSDVMDVNKYVLYASLLIREQQRHRKMLEASGPAGGRTLGRSQLTRHPARLRRTCRTALSRLTARGSAIKRTNRSAGWTGRSTSVSPATWASVSGMCGSAASPQEALAVYSGSDPHQSSTVFLNGGLGLGTAARSIIAGYDCPHEALVGRDGICVSERLGQAA
uniref:Amine oxidase catalytic domain-containing protein n=1 Tax=Mycena chlorophos TaxID=658473 RepID=A0ABQ0M217_MYCCL|nr:amine oxidase catalytic domain-containing protein [Mycena chlorophos]